MPEERTTRRRKEDTWDEDGPSSDQGLLESSVDRTAQEESLDETAMLAGPTVVRRTEDSWGEEDEEEAGPDDGPIPTVQDGSAQRPSVHPTELSQLSGTLSWNEILSSGDRPNVPALHSSPEPVSFPRFHNAPYQATPFEPQSSPTFVPQQVPLALPRLDNLSQTQRWGRGNDPGLRFQPYLAGPIPRSLEEVQVPDRAELAAMEQIHGRPRPMSETTFHHFHRGYRVPLDIASEMRAQAMIGVYPSSLVYLDYQRLAAIPTQRHRASGAVIPALYWVRILIVKQGPYREHVEHLLSGAPAPCRCHNCEYDRGDRVMSR